MRLRPGYPRPFYGSISIHAPREGCDASGGFSGGSIGDFNPRTPRGVRRCACWNSPLPHEFQSTHPARGATLPAGSVAARLAISIHAPREGCDAVHAGTHRCHMNFNPRTPRGVRRFIFHDEKASFLFQSTHPARGATEHAWKEGSETTISIHAPREGCDGTGDCIIKPYTDGFQSTHPARGATAKSWLPPTYQGISIHAPREGCDLDVSAGDRLVDDFNPRTPRGVRLMPVQDIRRGDVISIHAPREGCDFVVPILNPFKGYFNPRTPRGVRHVDTLGIDSSMAFQSTHPARGATETCAYVARYVLKFQSTHPARGATFSA